MKKLLFILLGFLFIGSANGQYTSNGTATAWNTTTGWSCTCVPDLSHHSGSHDTEVSHDKTVTGVLHVKNNNVLTIKSGATVTVTGDLWIGSDGFIVIESGGTLTVQGQVKSQYSSNTGSPSSLNVNAGGTFNVTNDFNLGGSTQAYLWNGDVNIGGDLWMNGNTTLTVAGGNIAVTGKFSAETDAHLTGDTGTITYASYNLAGSGKVTCNGTLHSGTSGACNNVGVKNCTGAPALTAGGFDFATCLTPCPVATVGGTVTTTATVCSGANGATLTLAGHTGSVTKWQKNENGGGWTDLAANNSTTQAYSNVTAASTVYRALVSNGATCDTENSATATITTNPTSVGGTISADATVCNGTNGATLTLSGHTGTITRWEKNENGGGWTSIANGGSATYAYSNLTVTTEYRVVLTSGVCAAANSAAATITVSPTSVGGSINNTATVCSGSNGATLTLSGHTGTITRWEKNENGGGWASIANGGSTTYTYSNLTVTTEYRAVLTSGVCAAANSATSTITVNPISLGGSIASSATVCSGSNGATLTLSGHTGTITRWEKNENGGGWTSIANGGSTIYAYSNITVTTEYRAVLTSGVCAATNSATATITVDEAPVGGSIATATSGCYGDNGATLTLSGHSGTITKWQKNENGGGWTDIANGGSTTYAYSNLVITTQYRAVMDNGVCTSANSADATITVYADLTAGTIGTAQSISSGVAPATLTETVAPVGGDGSYTYQWESSTDNVSWSNAGGTDNQATYSPGVLTANMWYRRVLTSGSSCGSETSNTIEITITTFVCSGSSPSTTTSTTPGSGGGGGAPTYQWEISTDGSNYSDIGSATSATYTPSAVTQNTWYRRKVIINGCVGYSNVLTATLTAGGYPGGLSTGLMVWLKADAGTNNIGTQWEDQSGLGNHYTTVAGPTLESGDESSNYNPYVKILSGGFNAPSGAALGANYTVIAAAKKISTDISGRLFDGDISTYNFGFDNNPIIAEVQTMTNATNGAASGVKVDINQGFTSSNGCHSHVYELIIYNKVLSASEILKIESYLETKYGVEDGGNNYVSSTGVSTYDVSSYTNDIIGIGKECYFTQKQSQSEDDTVRVFVNSPPMAATNALNGGTITNDVSYLMLGHDNGLLIGTGAQAANIPPANTDGYTVTTRIDRQWKVTNTNFTDNFYLEIEIKNQGTVTNLTDLCLIVDDDDDFTSGANLHVYATGDNGLQFAFGSIIVGPIAPAIIPAGGVKFIALGSKDPATALPVELLGFHVNKKEDYNLISWVTGSEINSSHFVVEKSVDGINWETIEITQAAGKSTSKINYTAMDHELCVQKCYYRLNQVDIDGTNEYSDVKVVESSREEKTALIVYPVPVSDAATVRFTANSTSTYTVEVTSITGANVYEANVVCVEGENVFDINASGYTSGLYYLVIRNIDGEIVNKERFVK